VKSAVGSGKTRYVQCISALLLVLLLEGCQSTASVPGTARSADTAAASSGVALDEQTARKAPEIAPTLSVLEPPDLWREIRNSFELDHNLSDTRVQQELAWLKRHPKYLLNLQTRLDQYLAYIHQRVADRGLPGEITLLPIVESALDPYAFSPGGAAGLWQFISATGKRFGLQRNWWYDGRRDPIAATEAALDYLEYLYKRFDDWELALAGYNAGEGNVARALRRKGGSAAFWELRLPRETSAYVPRLLALSALIADPGGYDITLPALSPEIPFTIVDTKGQLDLNVAAEATLLEISTLYRWNPALNQWSTPPSGPNHLLLPRSAADGAQNRIDAIPTAERVRWARVKVGNGDTLSELALRHRTDVASLKQANNLNGNRIRAGQALLIPKSPQAFENPIVSRNSGDHYTVREGDSLWTISRAHGVSMNKLMRTNHVGPKDYLKIGQRLIIPGNTGDSGTRAVVRKVRYGVRSGDSLARIASKFNVKVHDISHWNGLNVSDYLQPGQSLTLYVDVAAGD